MRMQKRMKFCLSLSCLAGGLTRSGVEVGSAELMPLLKHQKGLTQVELQQQVQSWMREKKYQAEHDRANRNFSAWANVIFDSNARAESLTKLSGRMFFTHIAKCSGGSAVEQIKEVLRKIADRTTVFDDREECYGYTRLGRFGPEKANVSHYLTMLRSPRHQVVSQFFMLKVRTF